nr:hypothetical protein [Corallococcus coralloides]
MCQPVATDRPTRPWDRLSTTDHCSAMSSGSCSGNTTLPERRRRCFVTVARPAATTAGCGYRPPNEWKCRSGVHTAEKPFASANFAPSSSSSYLGPWSVSSSLAK